MRSVDEILEAASAGAAFLDETMPDWHKRVIRDLLDQSSAQRCVVAQITNRPFTTGMYALGIASIDRAVSLGLLATNAAEYPGLTIAWRHEINARYTV